MSDTFIFQDIIGPNPKVLVLFDKFDFDDLKKGQSFSAKHEKHVIKEITTRGFTTDNLAFMYVKNKASFDVEGNLIVTHDEGESKTSKGRITINDEDRVSFDRRFTRFLTEQDIKVILVLGKEVAYTLQQFGYYKAGQAEQKLDTVEIMGGTYTITETISALDYDVGTMNRAKLLEVLDLVYSTMFEVTSIDNASYIELDQMSEYLKKCMMFYDHGMIDSLGFDYETNGKEWSEPWSKLVAVSFSDNLSNHAFSCALYHPEKILHKRKKQLLTWLFKTLLTVNCTTNEEYVALASKLERFYKVIYPMIEELPYKEVLNDDEYTIINTLPILTKVLKRTSKKSFDEKQPAIKEFLTTINDSMKRLAVLIRDNTYINKLNDFYLLLDKVLSKIPVVGHNVKFDIGWCANMCIGLKNLKVKADTFGEAVAIYGQDYATSLDLETLSVKVLGVENKWKSAFHSSPRLGHGSSMRFDRVPLKLLGPYSAADAITTDMLEKHFKKEIINTPLELLDKEQNLAIVMFSLGEVHGFSVHPETCTKLYKFVNNNLTDLAHQLVTFPVVVKFVNDRKAELPEAERDKFAFNTNTSGAQSHNAAVLFRKEYYGLQSITSTDSGYPSADADSLKTIKKQLETSLKEYDEAQGQHSVVCLNNGEVITPNNYNTLKEAMMFCDNLIKTSGFAQLNNMYYKISYDEKKDKPLDKFIAVFKLVGATKTGRLSSRFHLAPKTGGVRYVYCSAWCKDNIRNYQFEHKPGTRYEPLYGLMDVTYEDGTTEKVSYDTLLRRGYTPDEIKSLFC